MLIFPMDSSFKKLDCSFCNLTFLNSAENCPRSTQTVPRENILLFLRSFTINNFCKSCQNIDEVFCEDNYATLQLSPCSAPSVSDFPVYI